MRLGVFALISSYRTIPRSVRFGEFVLAKDFAKSSLLLVLPYWEGRRRSGRFAPIWQRHRYVQIHQTFLRTVYLLLEKVAFYCKKRLLLSANVEVDMASNGAVSPVAVRRLAPLQFEMVLEGAPLSYEAFLDALRGRVPKDEYARLLDNVTFPGEAFSPPVLVKRLLLRDFLYLNALSKEKQSIKWREEVEPILAKGEKGLLQGPIPHVKTYLAMRKWSDADCVVFSGSTGAEVAHFAYATTKYVRERLREIHA